MLCIIIRTFAFSTLIYSNMGRFINPFTDVGFKRIFGQEFSKPLLLDFLNNLLKGERDNRHHVSRQGRTFRV